MNNLDKKYNELIKNETITDENVEDVLKILNSVSSDDIDFVKNLPSNNGVDTNNENTELVSEVVNATIDPINGKVMSMSPLVETPTEESLDELMNLNPEEIKRLNIDLKSAQDSVNTIYPGIKIEDFDLFMKAVNKYKNDEKFSYYNSLPDSMKDQINMVIGAAGQNLDIKELRNFVAKSLFDQVIQDNYVNKTFTDLQTVVDNSFKEMNEENIKEFSKYNIIQREKFIEGFVKTADSIQDKEPEKAETLRAMSDNFIESYTYEKMYELYTTTGKLKAKKIELEKFDKLCNEFLYKYEKSKFVINDISTLVDVLFRHLPRGTANINIIKRFIIAFTKYTINMKPENLPDHVFMYYFVKHILNLDFYDKENTEEVKFYKDLLNNISNFINLIKERS